MSSDVVVTLDGERCWASSGRQRIQDLKRRLAGADSLVLVQREGSVRRWLTDGDDLEVEGGMVFELSERLLYRPSARHKRHGGPGEKGTVCPEVDGAALLERSEVDDSRPRKRWAVHEECVFCAHSDNAGGWHGFPERPSRVPVPIWRRWVAQGQISPTALRKDYLCEG